MAKTVATVAEVQKKIAGVDVTRELQFQIDRLGSIRDQISLLKKDEELIAKDLKARLPKGVTFYGDVYETELVESTLSPLDPVKVKKLLGDKRFMEIASVTQTAAKKYLTEGDMDKCAGERTFRISLTVKRSLKKV